MSVFALENFHQVNGYGIPDIFGAQYVNLRFEVPRAKFVTIDASNQADLPGIAAQELGSRFLWWVLLMYNGIEDSINDVYPGMQLAVPDSTSLLTYLRTTASSSNYVINLNPTIL